MRQWLARVLNRWSLWLDPGLAPADRNQEIAELRYHVELWKVSSKEMGRQAAEWQAKYEQQRMKGAEGRGIRVVNF